MDDDYMKRGYLLPEGCRDLIDVLKSKVQHKQKPPPRAPKPLPPIVGEMSVAEQMTVGELAALLKQKPFKIIADLMEIGVFVNVHGRLHFDIVAKVVRRYGYTAKKAV
jgi:hypothetical protein